MRACTAHASCRNISSRSDGAADQVFKPYECNLRSWDAEKFSECTAARRIIMIGDSLMRQQFMSLACLANDVVVRPSVTATCCICPEAKYTAPLSAPWLVTPLLKSIFTRGKYNPSHLQLNKQV